jgi:hypothetical protein
MSFVLWSIASCFEQCHQFVLRKVLPILISIHTRPQQSIQEAGLYTGIVRVLCDPTSYHWCAVYNRCL